MSFNSPSPDPLDLPPHLFSFPLSSSREEPRRPYAPSQSPSGPLNPLLPSLPLPKLDHAYDKYAIPHRREIFPGILEDGTITVRHTFVDRYLSNIPRAPNDRYTQHFEPDNFFGEKRKHNQSLAEVIGIHEPLTNKQTDCIFALAALKVFYHPHHPAHFSFWGKDHCKKTAERVQSVLDMNPCPIASPVGWIGVPENVWLVDGMQAQCFPPRPIAKKVNGMTLRKRKARELKEGDATHPDRPRVKRVRTAAKHSAPDGLSHTPVRQSARLASSTPQPGSSRLPTIPPLVTATHPESSPKETSSKEAKAEQIASSSLVDGAPDADTGLLFSPPSDPSQAPSSTLPDVNLKFLANLVSEISSPPTSDPASVPAPSKRRQTPQPAPTATRRSTRQPKPSSKRMRTLSTAPSTPSASPDPTPSSLPDSLPDADVSEEAEAGGRPTSNLRRARSSSSAKSVGSSATAVSEANSAIDTAVEDSPELKEKKLSGKGKVSSTDTGSSKKTGGRKRKLDEVDENIDVKEGEDDEKVKEVAAASGTRSSGRKRKPTAAVASVAPAKAKGTQAQASKRPKGRPAKKP